MARSKMLTMAGKRQVATFGVVAVVLLLAKFFPMVYGGLLNQTQRLTRADASRSSEILNGVILLSLGVVWFMLSKLFSYAPFVRNAWNISGIALIGIGVLLVSGQNPFKDNANFELTGYQA